MRLRDDFPESAEVRLGLARAQLERRDADAAIVELTKAVELDPGLGDAWALLGALRFEAGDPAGAEADQVIHAESCDQRTRKLFPFSSSKTRRRSPLSTSMR